MVPVAFAGTLPDTAGRGEAVPRAGLRRQVTASNEHDGDVLPALARRDAGTERDGTKRWRSRCERAERGVARPTDRRGGATELPAGPADQPARDGRRRATGAAGGAAGG
ncbi:hypothetical protein Francci3_1485 [Frankia casuarinae]|uniref:Uncharacterized protein n=1 Tax=Frankia casuarinae (strain DSM 45818 / CECT 9043 / HFP020203 / CcI3) TaxID=106370 RepID=Q2JCY1_FRACC|nr:hypothetical protein Francci3_1485 [Frankia casuarinae]